MNLRRDSREYANWPISGAPEGSEFEIRFYTEDDDGTWLPMEATAEGARILVAGPDAVPDTATVLPLGETNTRIRLVGPSEIPVRYAGTITVH